VVTYHRLHAVQLAPNTADSAEWVATKWDAAEHLPVIQSFLSSLKVRTFFCSSYHFVSLFTIFLAIMQVAQVFAWLDKLADDKLMLSTSLQTQPDKALFFTRDTERLILPDNIQVEVSGGWGPFTSASFTAVSQDITCINARIQEVVQVGVIQGGDTMQALLRLMSTLYAPQFITGSLWPESIKKDFIGMMSCQPSVSCLCIWNSHKPTCLQQHGENPVTMQVNCTSSWQGLQRQAMA
jgi:hypothetical protein